MTTHIDFSNTYTLNVWQANFPQRKKMAQSCKYYGIEQSTDAVVLTVYVKIVKKIILCHTDMSAPTVFDASMLLKKKACIDLGIY